MFSKISLKVKMIVFLLACVVAVFTLINSGIQNRKNHPSNNINKPQTVTITASDIKKNDETVKKSDENKQNADQINKDDESKNEEQAKALEDKYNEGYKAFFDHKYAEAINTENEVLSQDESFYKAYNLKGIALCFRGNYDEGMKNIDKALSLKPDFGYAVFNKALAYELFGHYEEAIEWYNKDLKIESYIWSYYGIASIYGRRGDVNNTLKYLKQAAALDNGVKALAKDEKDFNPVKNSKEFQSFVNS